MKLRGQVRSGEVARSDDGDSFRVVRCGLCAEYGELSEMSSRVPRVAQDFAIIAHDAHANFVGGAFDAQRDQHFISHCTMRFTKFLVGMSNKKVFWFQVFSSLISARTPGVTESGSVFVLGRHMCSLVIFLASIMGW
jgi:hypothetical protein